MPKVGMQPIRRQQLIEATLQAVDQVGMGDASIALIARLAGVSNGIISHYFKDKNGLLDATMRHLMQALSDAVRQRRAALRNDNPRAHLRAIIEGNFDDSQVSGPAMKTWLAFWASSMHQPSLRRLLAEAESVRSELRFIHLSQHYKTVQFLKPEQIKRYNVLRGYADDPCKNIPAGHNPEMYRRHMGCS